MADEAPYEQSRAALRRMYGSRKIDASAPPSMQDTTPSARNRRALMASRGNVKLADMVEEQGFQSKFQPRPDNFTQPMGRPTAWNNIKQPTGDQVSPEMIAKYQSTGIKPGFFETPYGMVGVTSQAAGPDFGPLTTPSQMALPTPLAFNLSTPSPVGASALSRYMPSQSSTYTPPWRKQSQPQGFMASILEGASKWLV